MQNFLKNYFSSIFFVILIYFFYSINPYFISYFSGNIEIFWIVFNIYSVFFWIICSYLILLIPYYFVYQGKSKCRKIFEYIISRKKYWVKFSDFRLSILNLIVKWFFAPLMINWLFIHIATLLYNIHNLLSLWDFWNLNFFFLFNNNLFRIIFQTIFFADVLFFTIWYLIEIPFLKNEIKSVETSIFGWIVCIMCYPPFNMYTNQILWWYSNDFPHFDNDYVHLFMNISILVLMSVYSRTSISLNFKASNLTNRWIITTWVYKYIRHPAYFCKNMAWLIWAFPTFIIYLWAWNYKMFSIALFSVIGRMWIYITRAITEEKHLLKWNNWYKEYMKKVKYRFIPGVI